MRKTTISASGKRIYHSYRRNEIFHTVSKKDERLMDKSDIVSIAPGFYGRFKELMPAQAKEEELAIQKGKIILYESMFNLEADERMKEEAAIDRMIMEYERD